MSQGNVSANKFALLFAKGTKQPAPRVEDKKPEVVAKKVETTEKKPNVDRKKTDNKAVRGPRDGQRRPRNTDGKAPRNTEGKAPRDNKDKDGKPRQKRQFDRRSGTGRNPTEEKKGGAGKANWGNHKDAEKDVVETVEATSEETVVEEAPEAKTFTLAEFEKQKEQNAVKVDRPAPRVVEEDAELQKKFTKLEKKIVEKTQEKKETKEKTTKKQFVPLNEILDVKVPQNDRFAARGGQKGGRKNGPRNNNTFSYDQGAFPALQ